MKDSYKKYVVRGFDKHDNPIYIYDARKINGREDYNFCFVAKLNQAQTFFEWEVKPFMEASKHRFASISPKIVAVNITLEELEDDIIEV